jgi:dipeptidyl aminopeptidase/acylaminoacyl peptidase
MRYRAAPLTSVLVMVMGLFGCGGGSGGGPTGPTEGTLEVITSTTGSDLDPDGYWLTVDEGAASPIAPNSADTVVSLNAGTHTVTLASVASNCVLGGENPRTVDVAAGGMARLRFEVACSQAAPGAVRVSVSTTGDDLDPDGYEVALDGGTPKPLVTNGSMSIAGVTPGDHEIALSDVADNCELSGTNPLTATVVSGATTNTTFTVTCGAPLVAPGHDIAFTLGLEVYLLSADGTTITNLSNEITSPSNDPSAACCPAWSPDGQKIAFDSNREFSSNRSWDHIFVMNADGSGQTQLTSGEYHDGWPAWSPDGGRIAFASYRSGRLEIHVMNSDGSGVTQLTDITNPLARSPSWSPDGTRIAFTSGSTSSDVFVMNADGSEIIQLTTDPSGDRNPAWSPDGAKIAFESGRDGNWHIYVMNPDGSGVTQLTFGSQPNNYPAWSPDGSKIAFASSRTGTDGLYMMNPDGTEQVPLTRGSYGTARPAWRPE